jgi:hypothetical protein
VLVNGTTSNVGIGTSSPNGKLQVKQANTAYGLVVEASGNDAWVRFHHNDSVGIVESTYDTAAGYTPLTFKTGGTERLRILSTGGITFNGDTAAANALADYEEGTFTPYLYADSGSGITYSAQSGKYTKIGNVVHYGYVLALTSKGTISGSIYLAGLPFEVEGGYVGSAEPWGISISLVNGLATSVVSIGGWSNNLSTIVQLRKQTAAATSFGSSYLDAVDISNSFYIQFSGTYRV